ncbi:hypothetical protein Vafri_13239 [Volvox africanus]|uniref:Pherophorin domain-containing protein n=1 Tax=Volvox africanus TaxID=51714 RepID=A0A8J4F580_9CHLO|nr:hypothetical protein Vafri_13239 [Volvox africanus]
MRWNSLLFTAVVLGWFAGSHAESIQFPSDACKVCINAELYPPEIDYRPYRFDEKDCNSFQSSVASLLNNVIDDNGGQHNFGFLPDPSLCEATKVSICDITSSPEDELVLLQGWIIKFAPAFYDAVTGGKMCHPKYENYGLAVTVDSCGDLLAQPPDVANECGLLPPPSINCTCNTTTGISPYIVSSSFREEPSSNSQTALYCFDILVNKDILPSTCSDIDILRKVEFYAEQSLKSFVKSFRLSPNGGSPTTISPSWGPTGSNLLKASLYWTKDQATGASVCVEVKKPMTMLELCGGWKCYVYLFNPDLKCCPLSTSAP